VVKSWSEYVWFPIDNIQDADGQTLYVLCRSKQKEEIIEVLCHLAEDSYAFHTKERVGLADYIQATSEYALRTNFWWDITSEGSEGNDWMVCFGGNIRSLVIAIIKVCEKHAMIHDGQVPQIGPAVPPKSEKPVRPTLEVEDLWRKRAIEIRYPDGRKTIIVKDKIIEVDDTYNDVVKVKVRTRAGAEKWLEISIGLSSTRSLLLGMLKDWPKVNQNK
jgi:hypothetical protein